MFLGGDLLPSGLFSLAGPPSLHRDFLGGFLAPGFLDLRDRLGAARPEVFLILGNDDARVEEAAALEAATRGAWHYAHPRRLPFAGFEVFGYAFVPPTPFLLKDWERYDVSRFVDPGCVSPEEGRRTMPVAEREARYSTIAQDLVELAGDASLERAIFLFHTPPYDSSLDRAALDGRRSTTCPSTFTWEASPCGASSKLVSRSSHSTATYTSPPGSRAHGGVRSAAPTR